jgi:hypothetical protein
VPRSRISAEEENMSNIHIDDGARGAGSENGGNAAALGAIDLLCLAAAPTFAIMALMTVALGGDQMAMMCSTAQAGSLLSGMVPMYLLMSVFHSAPWLRLITNYRSGPLQS